jgi:hypothetical protein
VNITRWGTIFSKFRIVLQFVGAIFQDFFFGLYVHIYMSLKQSVTLHDTNWGGAWRRELYAAAQQSRAHATSEADIYI